jgi:hypothetical protein
VSEVIQILVLCITLGLFVSWVLTLKKQLCGAREEVLRLRQVVAELAEKEAAEKAEAAQKELALLKKNRKSPTAAGTQPLLYMVGNAK